MVEIIPKPAKKIPSWQNILFYFSVVFLLVSFLSYLILNHFVKVSSQTLDQLEKTLAREKTPSEIALEEEVFGYQKKINAFSQLIKEHLFTSNFFTFSEKICHPKVQISQLNLEPAKGIAILSGQAEDFSVLGQQLLLLKEEPQIADFNLADISIGKKGKVDFTLKLTLNPQLFELNE